MYIFWIRDAIIPRVVHRRRSVLDTFDYMPPRFIIHTTFVHTILIITLIELQRYID